MVLADLVVPQALMSGDKIAAATLSWGGPGAHPKRYLRGKKFLSKAFNLQAIEMSNTLRYPDWVRQNPQVHADYNNQITIYSEDYEVVYHDGQKEVANFDYKMHYVFVEELRRLVNYAVFR